MYDRASSPAAPRAALAAVLLLAACLALAQWGATSGCWLSGGPLQFCFLISCHY